MPRGGAPARPIQALRLRESSSTATGRPLAVRRGHCGPNEPVRWWRTGTVGGRRIDETTRTEDAKPAGIAIPAGTMKKVISSPCRSEPLRASTRRHAFGNGWIRQARRSSQQRRIASTAVSGCVAFSTLAPRLHAAPEFPAVRLRDRHLILQNAENSWYGWVSRTLARPKWWGSAFISADHLPVTLTSRGPQPIPARHIELAWPARRLGCLFPCQFPPAAVSCPAVSYTQFGLMILIGHLPPHQLCLPRWLAAFRHQS